MLVLKSRLGQWVSLGIGMAVCMGNLAPGWADIVHFANGNDIRGKLDRVTGDIIEFRRSSHFFGNMDYFKRIQLTDRHDVVETKDGSKYFGEIIYLDDLTLEIQTASGSVRINRVQLTGVVMGSPSDKLNVPSMNQVPPEPPMTTISNTHHVKPHTKKKGMFDPGEDEDAIPAVDTGN